MNDKPKRQSFLRRIVGDNHEFVVTFCICAIFVGFLFCLTAVLYKIVGATAKVDDSLMNFFKEYDDLVKMILTYIFTRWQMTKAAEKNGDTNSETTH